MADNQPFLRLCCILVLFVAASGPVYADRVSGTVRPTPDDLKFEIKDSKGNTLKTVRISENGKFTVFLKPGLYAAASRDGSATVRSESVPLTNQTIEFQ